MIRRLRIEYSELLSVCLSVCLSVIVSSEHVL